MRAFLSIEEISKQVKINQADSKHIIAHLIRKRIVHAVTENDNTVGYELVHDFLSKRFFERLNPEAKKSKTVTTIFRIAFKEWQQHGVLASKDRLEILSENIDRLNLTDEEWTFLIKSSFSVYWWDRGGNMFIKAIEKKRLIKICIELIVDKNKDIAQNAIRAIGDLKDTSVIPILKGIIESKTHHVSVRETAIS